MPHDVTLIATVAVAFVFAFVFGYGANWLTGWFAFDRDVLDGFGLKVDEKLAGFIHIGTPAKPAEDRPRPALSDIVTRF